MLDRTQGYAPLPWGIDLLLTDACNLRCTYCPITTDMLTLRRSAVMDTDKALRFLDSVAHFRPMIRMFGGEPLLHRSGRASSRTRTPSDCHSRS
jgi:sulfatase maturation enzyme AslB (radical SAM superfamily)